MGCGGASLAKLTAENTELSEKLTTVTKEKDWYNKDKLGLTMEVEKLRKENQTIAEENEGLRQSLRQSQSASTTDDPASFESLSEMLSLDQAAGDSLLSLLQQSHAPSAAGARSGLDASAELRQSPPTLPAYKTFLADRSKVLVSGWSAYVHDVDGAARTCKDTARSLLGETERVLEEDESGHFKTSGEKLGRMEGVDAITEFAAFARTVCTATASRAKKLSAEKAQQKEQYEAKLDKKKQKIDRLKEALKGDSSRKGQQELVEFEEKFAVLKERNEKLQSEISHLCATTDQLKTQQNTKMRKLKRLKDQWKGEMVSLVTEVKNYVGETKDFAATTCFKLQETNHKWLQAADSLLAEKSALQRQVDTLTADLARRNAEADQARAAAESHHAQTVSLLEIEKEALSRELFAYKQQMSDSATASDSQSEFYKSRLDVMEQEMANAARIAKDNIEKLQTEVDEKAKAIQEMVQAVEVASLLQSFAGQLREAMSTHNEGLATVYAESDVALCAQGRESDVGKSLSEFDTALQNVVQETQQFLAKDREVLSAAVTAWKRAKDEAAELSAIKDSLTAAGHTKDQELSSLQSANAQLSSEIQNLNQALSQNTEESQGARTALNEQIEQLKHDLAASSAATEAANSTIAQLKDQLQSLQLMLENESKAAAALREQVESKDKDLTEMQSQREQTKVTHESEIDRLRAEIQSLIASKSDADSASNEGQLKYQSEISRLSGELEDANSAKADLSTKLEAAEAKYEREVSRILGELETAKADLSSEISRLSGELEAANNTKADLSGEVSRLSGELETAKADLSSEISRLSGELEAVNTTKADLTGEVSRLSSGLEDANSAKADLSSEVSRLSGELEAANAAKADLSAEVSKLSGELEAANAAKADLSGEVSKLSGELEAANAAKADLSSSVVKLENSLREAEAKYKSEAEQLSGQLEESSSFFKSIAEQAEAKRQADIEQLNKQLEDTKSQLAAALSEVEAVRTQAAVSDVKKEQQEEPSVSGEGDEDLLAEDLAKVHDPETIAALEFVQRIINEENEASLANNVITETAKKVKGEKAMGKEVLIPLFEEIMVKKLEMDQFELSYRRAPQHFATFLLEFFTKKYSMKKLAAKNLAMMLAALDELCNENHPYASLFCRIMQVIHPEPFTYRFTVFLTQHWNAFTPLCAKYRNEKHGGHHERSADKTSKSGGHAWLIDVLQLVYRIFAADKTSGKRMLRVMKPPTVDEMDYIAFLIGERVSTLGVSLESLLNEASSGDKVTVEQFAAVLNSALSVWIPKRPLKSFFRTVSGGSHSVAKSAVCERISPEWITSVSRTSEYLTSKAAFVQALAEVHKTQLLREGTRVRKLLSSDEVAWPSFSEIMPQVDSSLDGEGLSRLWKVAGGKDSQDEALSCDRVVKAVLGAHVGRLSQTAFSKVHADAGQAPLGAEEESKSESPRVEAKAERGGRARRRGK